MSTAKTLNELAAELRGEVEALKRSVRTTLTHAIKIGQLLQEAKTLAKGKYGDWLEEHTGFSRATATNYLKIASYAPGFTDEELAELNVTGMLAIIKGKRRAKKADTKPSRKRAVDAVTVRAAAQKFGIVGDVFAFLSEIGVSVAEERRQAA
jgi:hypothetical protein